MSLEAQELDSYVMDLVRDPLRSWLDNEIYLSSMTIDVIRSINENGYVIVRRDSFEHG